MTALLQTGLCLTAEAYEDLTVEVGEELTISTNSFYNSITVNGTLTLDSKAVVKVENATGGGVVKVGSGAGVTGTLNIKDGANLTANNKSGAAVTLPLTFVGTVAPTSFAGWTVVVNGVVKPNWGIGFDGTKLSLIKPGTVILVR